MMRLRIGKFCGAANDAHGKFRDQRAPEGEDLVGEPAVFAGIVNVDAGAEDGGGFGLGGQGAPVRGRVYAAGHATNNDDPTGRKVARQVARPCPGRKASGAACRRLQCQECERISGSPRTYSATGGS